ncbi:MAG: response regulator [Balneola sp.]|mgnify:FL=1|jgi:CheY-like chemotaxis protein|nr:response regulator [Balneola sp.]MAO77913.1 response regulator [Balneola sp.]MBF65295.1 response regulator [Balneola sp.]HAW80540.1 response regulator [Balneola sp.]|tara:strand:+ start:3282 stop:4223 length:942 start_codon:yes stop_codon:yes gene_type:complete
MSSESDYTILVVDDDRASHIIVKNLIGKKYNLIHAQEPQQGINILSEKKIDLILSDIHMPGMTGLEFLEAIKKDAEKKNIPILLMTSLPTLEKEQKAMELGAKDFIQKDLFHEKPQEVAERIEMKLVTNFVVPDLSKKLAANQKEIVQDMMVSMETMDFLNVSQEFCRQLGKLFELEHLSFWKLSKDKPHLLVTVGSRIPENYNPADLYTELVFRKMIKSRKPYFTNNIYNTKQGVFIERSREDGLPAEMGVPMFAITESDLINNHMKIPEKAPIFGYMLMKRSKVFSTKEHAVISKLIVRCSTMIWRLYKAM